MKLKKAKSNIKSFERSGESGSFARLHSTMRDDISAEGHTSVLMSSMSNLSFASLQVPECKPADGEEDVDRKCYEQWKLLLEASMQLAGVVDETTKMNIFRIKAGSKLLDVLEGTTSNADAPDITLSPYSNAVHRLDAFFGSREYTFMQRQKLRSLTQQPGEKDVAYVKRVIAVAKLCDFSDANLGEQVADTIQSHALNRRVREIGRKILRKGGSIADLLEKVRTVEMEQLNEEIFAKSHGTKQAEVSAVAYGQARDDQSWKNNENTTRYRQQQFSQPRYFATASGSGVNATRYQAVQEQRNSGNFRGNRGGRGFDRRQFTRNTTTRIECWRCLSRYHQPSECHAITKLCRNCQRKGHIERACHQRLSSGNAKRRNSNDNKDTPHSKKIAIVKKDEDDSADESESGLPTLIIKSEIENVELIDVCKPQDREPCIAKETEINKQEKSVKLENSTTNPKHIRNFQNSSYIGKPDGIIVGRIAGVEVTFLIDSGADVNTVGAGTFEVLMNKAESRQELFCVQNGSDLPLKAYATSAEIRVLATFEAELVISEDSLHGEVLCCSERAGPSW
ncbi:uncharacterized protein LOC134209257 [Armigeres subalbatus]|uniref:uncharacterized protein LOC134209257 n=1 Tax=Armigeres subalbatus TaxID=124917 RepID=UPI002ED11C55